jgi:hypothetical protein
MQPQSPMTLNSFDNIVLEIATNTLKKGGTAFRLDGYQFLPSADVWEFPKYPSRTVILPPDADLVEELKNFIAANETCLREPDCWLGTWINPQTGCFYLDITTSCPDLNEAKRIAIETSNQEGRRIVALYNSKRKETVYL